MTSDSPTTSNFEKLLEIARDCTWYLLNSEQGSQLETTWKKNGATGCLLTNWVIITANCTERCSRRSVRTWSAARAVTNRTFADCAKHETASLFG